MSVTCLWCSWVETWCWIVFKAGWAGKWVGFSGRCPDLMLAPFTALCFHTSHPHLLLGKGLLTVPWALNLNWLTFVCFNSQLAPCLSLLLLLDICRRWHFSRAWHLGIVVCVWMWNADSVASSGFVNGEILYQRAMENQAPPCSAAPGHLADGRPLLPGRYSGVGSLVFQKMAKRVSLHCLPQWER